MLKLLQHMATNISQLTTQVAVLCAFGKAIDLRIEMKLYRAVKQYRTVLCSAPLIGVIVGLFQFMLKLLWSSRISWNASNLHCAVTALGRVIPFRSTNTHGGTNLRIKFELPVLYIQTGILIQITVKYMMTSSSGNIFRVTERGIHRRPVKSPHKWPVKRKMFPFDDVIMGRSSLLH